MPSDNADTLPEPSTVATVVLLLFHVPPVDASVRDTIEPKHALLDPRIVPADGKGLTVIT